MKKVLIVTYPFLQTEENACVMRADSFLKQLNKYGWEPLILADNVKVRARPWLWELFSIRKAMRLAKSEGIDLIYTLSPPSGSHLIGIRLKKKNPDIPWVADFSQLSEAGGRGLRKIKEKYAKRLTASVLDEADCIIAGEAEIVNHLNTEYEAAAQSIDICHIPDGQIQELSEQFEKACRIIAARKLNENNDE